MSQATHVKPKRVRVATLREEATIEAAINAALPMYQSAYRAGYLRACKVYRVRHPKVKAASKGL